MGDLGYSSRKNLIEGLLPRSRVPGELLGVKRKDKYLCQGNTGEKFPKMGVAVVFKNP